MNTQRFPSGPHAVHRLAFAVAVLLGACSGESTNSPCGGCADDELCVQFYDGTCRPMSATCTKVSATCLTAKTDPAICGMTAAPTCRNEICGSSDGGANIFMCGSPKCEHEIAGTDIGCYGP
jgi:hypothetical protein